jgi:hypothetical protein
MAPFIAVITVSEGGGNAAELRREEVGHDPVKEGARPFQFFDMVREVAGGLARHGSARWPATRLADAGKEKRERGGTGLVGRLACWAVPERWAR